VIVSQTTSSGLGLVGDDRQQLLETLRQ
jgi:hypothetical protein